MEACSRNYYYSHPKMNIIGVQKKIVLLRDQRVTSIVQKMSLESVI